jgi:hypothetical protein
MKTKNIGLWVIIALAVSMLAAPAVHSQAERFQTEKSWLGIAPSQPFNLTSTCA